MSTFFLLFADAQFSFESFFPPFLQTNDQSVFIFSLEKCRYLCQFLSYLRNSYRSETRFRFGFRQAPQNQRSVHISYPDLISSNFLADRYTIFFLLFPTFITEFYGTFSIFWISPLCTGLKKEKKTFRIGVIFFS